MKVKASINELLDKFSKITEDPTSFLNNQIYLNERLRNLLKISYDATKVLERNSNPKNFTISKLVIQNFDTEQVWQQVELQNQFICNELENKIPLYCSSNEIVLNNDLNNSKKKVRFAEIDSESDDDIHDIDCKSDITDAVSEEDQNKESEDDMAVLVTAEESEEDNLSDATPCSKLDDKDRTKSSFEERQERLKKRVEKLEEEALAEKPWQLKGEVTAKKRPQNSLLEEFLDFDLTSRPAPIITEEAALKLEDVILKRIQNKAWDDVERKIKPVDTPLEFKKRLVLDQEKSKLSLAQIYEQEYLKQRQAANPANKFKEEEEPKEHKQIRTLLDSLFRKLDALSNYHYTPLPAVPELQIVTNLPAVEVEEAIPATASSATLLAPEEIQAKGKDVPVGNEERTSTDRKRARRKKKVKQRLKQKEILKREKILEKLKPSKDNSKYAKQKVKRELENLMKNTSVSQFQQNVNNDKSYTSSKQFFGILQDTVTDSNKNKSKRRKEMIKMDAKKIKL